MKKECGAKITVGSLELVCELHQYHDVLTKRETYKQHHVASYELTDDVSHATVTIKWVRPPQHTVLPPELEVTDEEAGDDDGGDDRDDDGGDA